jgi:hypothetical protein
VLLAPIEDVLVLDVGSMQFTSQQSFHPEGGLASWHRQCGQRWPGLTRRTNYPKISKKITKNKIMTNLFVR